MDSIDYKQKYLKYKNKYLELKTQQEMLNQQELLNQTGGFVYAPGKYLFFIPQSKADFDSQTPKEFGQKKLVDANGTIIGSLDSLTNYLGNCTKFLRVGKTSTGFDFANTYNTLYSNQSSTDVIKRETNDAYIAAKPYIDTTINTTKQVAEQVAERSWNTAKQIGNKIGEQAQKMMDKKPTTNDNLSDSTIHTSDLDVSESRDVQPQTQTQTGQIGQTGGEGQGPEQCVREPKKLSSNLLIGDINSVKPDKLSSIVKFIVDNNLQGTSPDNKISRIILVEKPIMPGKPSTIDMVRNFVVNYNGNNIVVNQKQV